MRSSLGTEPPAVPAMPLAHTSTKYWNLGCSDSETPPTLCRPARPENRYTATAGVHPSGAVCKVGATGCATEVIGEASVHLDFGTVETSSDGTKLCVPIAAGGDPVRATKVNAPCRSYGHQHRFIATCDSAGCSKPDVAQIYFWTGWISRNARLLVR